MLYKHGYFLCFGEMLWGYRYLGEKGPDGHLMFEVVPIGSSRALSITGVWTFFDAGLVFRDTPSDQWLVLNGLGLPDELVREVFWFVNRYYPIPESRRET